jgi:hypothetical protein
MGKPYESHPGLLRLATFMVEYMNFCALNWWADGVYLSSGHLSDLYAILNITCSPKTITRK